MSQASMIKPGAGSIIANGKLVYGMQLPVQSLSRIFAEDWELDVGSDAIATIARKADQTGFFYIAVCDHIAIPRDKKDTMDTQWYDTVATLGYLAAITDNVRLLSHVYNAGYRHPLDTAKAFMTLDELSGGRIILGVGVGHVVEEFNALGLDFNGRGAVTDEAIDAIRAAFGDEFPRHHGTRWHIEELGLAPRPRQAHIPIWVGGSSRPAIRRAALRGDGWLPQGLGRIGLYDDVQRLMALRRAQWEDSPVDIGTITEPLYIGYPDWDVGNGTLSGDPGYIAEQLRYLGDQGANHLQIRFRCRSLAELLDQMEAFYRDVAPQLN